MKLRLREVRRARFLTQGELASRTGLTETTISRLEMGITEPRLKTVRKLAAALEVAPDELVVAENTPLSAPGPAAAGDVSP